MTPPLEVRPTALAEVKLIVPRVFRDPRGFFLETFNRAEFESAGFDQQFVQDNHSRSVQGVLRGLHYQFDKPQGKLVRVARGKTFDVAVDIRRGSPTFGRWVGEILDDREMRMLWIPPGFAHGFCTLSDHADVTYKCTELYVAADDRGVRWDDPMIGIPWPVQNPSLSEKDRSYQLLSDERADLPDFA